MCSLEINVGSHKTAAASSLARQPLPTNGIRKHPALNFAGLQAYLSR
jgi:D-serine deaminase-like pyridoxal phosphate-dependent protein